MFPFKIYSIANTTATDVQRKIYTDLGLNIDDYTIQIRSGLIGFRPYVNFPWDSLYSWAAYGNFEQPIYCKCTDFRSDTDDNNFYYQPTPNTYPGFTSVILNDSTDTLIVGRDSGGNLIYNAQIALDPKIELVHLHHPPAFNRIVSDEDRNAYTKWNALTREQKKQFISIESDHLKKYMQWQSF